MPDVIIVLLNGSVRWEETGFCYINEHHPVPSVLEMIEEEVKEKEKQPEEVIEETPQEESEEK